jgi:predicted oxidoreductase
VRHQAGQCQRPAHRIKSYDSSRAHVVASVDASLKALRTDHIDLLLLHRPDLLLDPDELADTLRRLLAAGKVLHFGVSNHTPGQLAMLRKRHPGGHAPVRVFTVADEGAGRRHAGAVWTWACSR